MAPYQGSTCGLIMWPGYADANNSPDVSVRKGYVATNSGDWCNANPDNGTGNNQRAMAPPEDTLFTNFSNGGSKGNGHWDCATYWSFNHQTAAAPTVRADGGSGVCGTPDTTTLSRYDVYTYEMNQNLAGDWSRGTAANAWAPGYTLLLQPKAAKTEALVCRCRKRHAREALALYRRH